MDGVDNGKLFHGSIEPDKIVQQEHKTTADKVIDEAVKWIREGILIRIVVDECTMARMIFR
jgi:hypothetical protein